MCHFVALLFSSLHVHWILREKNYASVVGRILVVYFPACRRAAPRRCGEPSKDIHPVNFNIPSLPLVQALARYGEASGFAVLVDSGMAAGRRSSPVKGYLDPYLALTYLLHGSGLTARYTGANAFTLMVKSAEVTRKPGSGNTGDVSTPGLGASLRRRFAAGAATSAVSNAAHPSG